MIVMRLTEHHLEFVSLKGGCRGSSESTHVKMPYCWKSHALARTQNKEGPRAMSNRRLTDGTDHNIPNFFSSKTVWI